MVHSSSQRTANVQLFALSDQDYDDLSHYENIYAVISDSGGVKNDEELIVDYGKNIEDIELVILKVRLM